MAKCSTCGEKFPRDQIKNRTLRCPECWRALYKKRREANPEKVRAATRRWQANNREYMVKKAMEWNRAHPERTKASQKRWYAKHGAEYREKNREKMNAASRLAMKRERVAHPERVRERKKRLYAKDPSRDLARKRALRERDPELAKAKRMAYYAAHREMFVTASMRVKANRRRAAGSHTTKEWLELLDRHNYLCAYCPTTLTRSTAQRDHVVALSRGGTNDISNIVPACGPCNNRKRCRSADEFRAIQQ